IEVAAPVPRRPRPRRVILGRRNTDAPQHRLRRELQPPGPHHAALQIDVPREQVIVALVHDVGDWFLDGRRLLQSHLIARITGCAAEKVCQYRSATTLCSAAPAGQGVRMTHRKTIFTLSPSGMLRQNSARYNRTYVNKCIDAQGGIDFARTQEKSHRATAWRS